MIFVSSRSNKIHSLAEKMVILLNKKTHENERRKSRQKF